VRESRPIWRSRPSSCVLNMLLASLLACGGRISSSSSPSDAATLDAEILPADVAAPLQPDVPDSATSDASTPGERPGSNPPDATVLLDGSGEDAPAADSTLPSLTCDSGDPVEVCVEYYQYLSLCFGRDLLDEACQQSLIPDGAADLAEIQMLCAANLQRIHEACQ
jgi:hypothetical protein